MDLLEYQAKNLFQQVGIPILSSQPIENVAALKRLQIPYPVVLKSQVRAGGRGRAGGVRFVENTIDAIAAAQSIFSLPIHGEYPEVVLAEARYDSQEEIFLAIVIDYQLQRPVLLGSVKGGMDVETLLRSIEAVIVEDFSPFYTRRLGIKMGLRGHLLQSVSLIVEKMYYLLIEKDLDLIEINPLGVSATGEVMALDGKITVNDAAIARHRDLQSLAHAFPPTSAPQSMFTDEIALPKLELLPFVDPTGDIGLITSSLGIALALWDGISQAQGKIKQGLILASGHPPHLFAQQLIMALHQLLTQSPSQVIAIVLVESSAVVEAVIAALTDYLQPQLRPNKGDRLLRVTGSVFYERDRTVQTPVRQSNSNELPPILIHLAGDGGKDWGDALSCLPLIYSPDLETMLHQILTSAYPH